MNPQRELSQRFGLYGAGALLAAVIMAAIGIRFGNGAEGTVRPAEAETPPPLTATAAPPVASENNTDKPVEEPPVDVAGEPAAEPAEPGLPASSPVGPTQAEKDERWQRISAAFAQAGQEAVQAHQEVTAAFVADFNAEFGPFEERAKEFARAVLGAEGKLRLAGSTAERAALDAIDGLDRLFGQTPTPRLDVPWADPFWDHVDEMFLFDVVSLPGVGRMLLRSQEEYVARLRAIEGRLLTGLAVDLPEAALDWPDPLPVHGTTGVLTGKQMDLITRIVGEARGDLSATAGQAAVAYVAGNRAGDWAASHIAGRNAPGMARAGIGLLGNLAAESATYSALEKLRKEAGDDPEGRISVLVASAVNDVLEEALNGAGESPMPENLQNLLALGTSHPDAEVRAACSEAADIMLRGQHFGLNTRLTAIYIRWFSDRINAVVASEIDPNLHTPFFQVDPATCGSRDELLAFASHCSEFYKEEEPWDIHDER